jgi:dihydroflavonol-4-reductase
MRPYMTGAELVIHGAAVYELGVAAAERDAMTAINVGGTENVLSLATELGVARTVYVSSIMALGDSGDVPRDESYARTTQPRSWYERTKMESHAVALRHSAQGLPLVIVAPSAVVGPNDHSIWGYFIRSYLNRILPGMAWGATCRQNPVYVDDLAEGIALAAERGAAGEFFLLCGETRTMREHLAFWAAYPGAIHPKVWLSPRIATALFAPVEPLLRRFGLPAFISRETVAAGAMNVDYSSEKARRDLGYRWRSAEEMWRDTFQGELALLAARPPRASLRDCLRPVA